MDMPIAPNIRSGRRPQRSTRKSPGTVLQMLTRQVTTETMKGLEMPAEVKYEVPSVELSAILMGHLGRSQREDPPLDIVREAPTVVKDEIDTS